MQHSRSLLSILVPLDSSDSSLMSEQTAAGIAKKTGAHVTILHVVPHVSGGSFEAAHRIPPTLAAQILSGLDQKAERVVGEAKALFEEEGVAAEAEVVREDDPASAILDFSKENIDLIVMGARGENEKNDLSLGSVTKKIITHAVPPIMIIKRVTRLTNLLVCVDGSENSLKALSLAADLAQVMDSSMTLLNVQEPVMQKTPEVAKALSDNVFSRSLAAVKLGESGIRKRVQFGVPSDAISDVAEKGKYDLIVLGRKGSGVIRKFLVGSITDDVSYKAKCSVLVVPA